MTLKYRWSLITSFVCSGMVALLWSLNLGAVYPFVEVVLDGHSLAEWSESQETESRNLIADRKREIESLRAGDWQRRRRGSRIVAARNSRP